MSAETLRRAAALMRERAEAARCYYAAHHPKAGQEVPWFHEADLYDFDDGDGPHIIGMSPAVALAVADWLAVTAGWLEDEFPDDPDAPMDWDASTGATAERVKAAITVARAYLGESA